jgi:hypothetical protein
VTLLGQVANDYERQLAHHYVRRVPGVAALVDNIAVDEPPPAELGPIGRLQARFAGLLQVLTKWLPSTAEENGEPTSRRARDAGRQANRRSRLTHPLTFTGVALGLVIIAVGAVVSRADATSLDARLATFPVKGSVVVGKEPPKGAFVVFHPISSTPNAPRPAGYVTKFGGYSLTTYESGDGAPPGDYRVTIEWRQAGGQRAKALSEKLASPKTTTLRAHVTSGGNVVAQFRL